MKGTSVYFNINLEIYLYDNNHGNNVKYLE